ncbi:MAG: HAMP domain-containing protein [bacterium]
MRKWSLYSFFFGALGVLVCFLLLAILLNSYYQKNALIETAIQEKIHLAETINDTIFSEIFQYREGRLHDVEKILINEMAKFEDVVYVRVISAQGKVTLSSLDEDIGKTVEDADIIETLKSGKTKIKDINYQGERIKLIIFPAQGDRTIWVGFTSRKIDLLIQSVTQRSVAVGLAALFLVFLFLFALLKNLIGPLKKITAACEKIRGGNLDARAEVKSQTEIGELADTFNKMVKDLKRFNTALEESKNVLEIKVKARTKELRELAESLEKRVQERTKELQKRIRELEKFHKLTVGRELKMIELKKELKKMTEKLAEIKRKV